MQHFIYDADNKAKLYIDADNGVLLISVCEGDKQLDFCLDEKEIEFVSYILSQSIKSPMMLNVIGLLLRLF